MSNDSSNQTSEKFPDDQDNKVQELLNIMTEADTPTPKKMKKNGQIFSYQKARDQSKLEASDLSSQTDINMPSTPNGERDIKNDLFIETRKHVRRSVNEISVSSLCKSYISLHSEQEQKEDEWSYNELWSQHLKKMEHESEEYNSQKVVGDYKECQSKQILFSDKSEQTSQQVISMMLDLTIEVVKDQTESSIRRDDQAEEVIEISNNNSIRKYLNNKLRPAQRIPSPVSQLQQSSDENNQTGTQKSVTNQSQSYGGYGDYDDEEENECPSVISASESETQSLDSSQKREIMVKAAAAAAKKRQDQAYAEQSNSSLNKSLNKTGISLNRSLKIHNFEKVNRGADKLYHSLVSTNPSQLIDNPNPDMETTDKKTPNYLQTPQFNRHIQGLAVSHSQQKTDRIFQKNFFESIKFPLQNTPSRLGNSPEGYSPIDNDGDGDGITDEKQTTMREIFFNSSDSENKKVNKLDSLIYSIISLNDNKEISQMMVLVMKQIKQLQIDNACMLQRERQNVKEKELMDKVIEDKDGTIKEQLSQIETKNARIQSLISDLNSVKQCQTSLQTQITIEKQEAAYNLQQMKQGAIATQIQMKQETKFLNLRMNDKDKTILDKEKQISGLQFIIDQNHQTMQTQNTFWTSIKSQFGEKDPTNNDTKTIKLQQENDEISQKLEKLQNKYKQQKVLLKTSIKYLEKSKTKD